LFLFLTAVPLYYPLISYPLFLLSNLSRSSSPSSLSSSSSNVVEDSKNHITTKKCDIFTGEWVPNPSAPYYTNNTCWAIHNHQNCMKYGRPDTDFMKWRWKPDDCELPIFNPSQFLELVRGKSLAFVGDSVGRNQMQSLICLLSRVEYPVDVSTSTDELSRRWEYINYNFTIENIWSPYLVKAREADPNGPAGTDLGVYYSYRKAFRTAFRAINSLKNFKGITFLRTFAPSHFENGLWNEGGNCVRRRPFLSTETHLDGQDLELYMTQLEEFKGAEREGVQTGKQFRLLDTTEATLMRPDGHPSKYGHWPEENATLYNDCVHWCLPGPIDTWNDFLLEMLTMEKMGSFDWRLHLSDRKMKFK
ncbi:hypothetical protein IFM89_013837, partial [Coptis chinensis]